MKNDNNIEQIYDWLESYDYSQLGDEQKNIVKHSMSVDSYQQMRKTLIDTEDMFAKEEDMTPGNKKVLGLVSFANKSIEFYKVAAAVALLIGLTWIVASRTTIEEPILLATVDTVYVKKTDTLKVYVHDTVEKVISRVVYREAPQVFAEDNITPVVRHTMPDDDNCETDICPGDLGVLTALKTTNSLRTDVAIRELMNDLE